MKINTTQVLKVYDGTPYQEDNKDLTLGKALAKILQRNQSIDPMRDTVLAKEIFTNDEVELNQSDLEYIKNAVKACDVYYTGVKGEILLAFNGIVSV